ncbi:MAG TPA: TonB-dependent receptor [Opitutaceae bacterium]|nr:TonB-dependent receptor [Opitutaceae bacterium]
MRALSLALACLALGAAARAQTETVGMPTPGAGPSPRPEVDVRDRYAPPPGVAQLRAGKFQPGGAGGALSLPLVEVMGFRIGQGPDNLPFAVEMFTAERLAAYPAPTLDAVLREDPSFSLFRRTTSLTSNPTSQGVSLREIGPSGASRSLVLLDGVPLNDPFGGWVVWSEVPRLSLREVAVAHGGGSGIWGNSALAGSISLIELEPPAGRGRAQLEAGASNTFTAETALAAPAGRGEISFDGRDFATQGFYNLAAGDRGPVDRPLRSDHRLGQLRLDEPVGSNLEVMATARLFDEARGNGTVLQQNATHQATAAVTIAGTPAGFDWEATAYVERESFSAFFSSVNPARTAETPANDQFDVPATAAGGSFGIQWNSSARHATSVGVDARQVEGETREDFSFSNGAFTGVRFAGGAQDFAGAFIHHDRELLPGLRLSGDLRLDQWENRDGHDREYKLATGAPTQLLRFPARSGAELDPNLGLVWKPAKGWSVKTSAYRGFRLPTLNEYYRPFRVGTVTTNANPNLAVEHLYGGELGAGYQAGAVSLQLTGFADILYDAVGTVTLSSSPSATTVQRQNLGAVRTRGAEAAATWTPAQAFRLRLGYLYDESIVARARQEPAVVGLRLPETPRGVFTAGADWDGPCGVKAAARLRWIGMQFDDDQNTLRLPAATLVGLELSRAFSKSLEAYLALDNAFNAQVATSLSTAGLFTYDTPRLLRGGIRVKW